MVTQTLAWFKKHGYKEHPFKNREVYKPCTVWQGLAPVDKDFNPINRALASQGLTAEEFKKGVFDKATLEHQQMFMLLMEHIHYEL